jgi:hypothetical protein
MHWGWGGEFAPHYFPIQVLNKSRDSSVNIATGYRLDGVGLISDSPQCPDLLWDPPSLLSNGYWD